MQVCTTVCGEIASIASGKPSSRRRSREGCRRRRAASARRAPASRTSRLGLLEPDPEYVPLAIDPDAEREVAGSALHRPALADLQHQRVEEEHRLDVVEWPLLPLADVVHHGVADAADQVAAD